MRSHSFMFVCNISTAVGVLPLKPSKERERPDMPMCENSRERGKGKLDLTTHLPSPPDHLEKSLQLDNATWSYDRLAVLAINYTSILAWV